MLSSRLLGSIRKSFYYGRLANVVLRTSCTFHNPNPTGMKVTICGAAGCTGQPLGLLLKQSPFIDEIALYDKKDTCGQAVQLNTVDTKCQVTSFQGRESLRAALRGARIVVMVVKGKSDTFEDNAPIVAEIVCEIGHCCPMPFIVVATEPVESIVPLIAELQRLRGSYNPRKLCGVTELHYVRANSVLAEFLRVPVNTVRVPTIGGASTNTTVPLMSLAVNPCELSQQQIECVTSIIMCGQDEWGCRRDYDHLTPCLAGAFGIARTVIAVAKGLQGFKIQQTCYCDSLCCCCPYCPFLATDVLYGPSGIETNLGLPPLSNFEACLLCQVLPYIRGEIYRAWCYVCNMITIGPPTAVAQIALSAPAPAPPFSPCKPPKGAGFF